MNAPSRMSEATIIGDIPKSTPLQELVFGAQPCAPADGTMTALSGPDRVLANPSPARAKGSVSKIPVISGPTGFGSLASCGLTRLLVSRCQHRASGSILYRLTWKVSVTPSGRLIYRLRASPRGLTYDSAFTGWPTATTPSGGQTWPQGTSGTGRRPDGSKATVNLEQVARLAGWCSSTAEDGRRGGLPPRPWDTGVPLSQQAALAGWGTPTSLERVRSPETMAKCADFRKRNANQNSVPIYLAEEAQLTGWATTTTTRDHRSDRSLLTSEALYGSKGQPLARQALYSDATGCSVMTPASGLLAPEHSRWLLRIPEGWGFSGDTAILWTMKRR